MLLGLTFLESNLQLWCRWQLEIFASWRNWQINDVYCGQVGHATKQPHRRCENKREGDLCETDKEWKGAWRCRLKYSWPKKFEQLPEWLWMRYGVWCCGVLVLVLDGAADISLAFASLLWGVEYGEEVGRWYYVLRISLSQSESLTRNNVMVREDVGMVRYLHTRPRRTDCINNKNP